MNIKLPFLALSAAAFFTAMPAAAQSMSQSPACIPAREAIVNLRPPFFGTPAVWDAVFGVQDNLMQFSGAVTLDNKNLLVAGESLDRDYRPLELVLVELNSRARVVAESRYPAKTGERSTGILKTAKGYAVSSTMRGGKNNTEKWARLSWYDADRKFLRDLILKDDAFDYESMSIAKASNGRGFVAVVKATNRQDETDQHGVLFRLGDSGQILWKRSYRPGITNHIYGVAIADGSHYMAGGQIRNEDGRMAGWLLKISDDGTIVWQNTYPRGQVALFRAGFAKKVPDDSDHYVVTGQIMPYGADPGAAWVLEVDSLGNTIWQRYFRADGYDIDGRGIQAYGDGRISVLVNAKAKGAGAAPDHIRLLTLSPRGGLTVDEAYLEGHRAEARQLINGWSGERVVTATIEVELKTGSGGDDIELITDALERQKKQAMMNDPAKSYGPPQPTREQAEKIAAQAPKEYRNEGWVFVATGLDPYEDPCVIQAATAAP